MPDKPLTIATYAAGASLAAITLVYVFGPTFFLDEEPSSANRKKGVVGLSNPANDCFINSILQALAGLPDLRLYLIRETHRRKLDGPEVYALDPNGQYEDASKREIKAWKLEGLQKGIVTYGLKDVLDKLNERPIYRKTISAQSFVTALEQAFRTRVSRQQQDAQEFLQVVTERLCEEYHAGNNARRKAMGLDPEESDERDRKQDQEVTNSLKESFEGVLQEDEKESQKSVHDDEAEAKEDGFPFEGQMESQIECLTCKFKPKPSISTFVTLTLNVPQSSSTTLNKCFDGMLKVEHIDDYICDYCRLDHALKTKQRDFARASSGEVKNLLKEEIEKLQKALEQDPEEPPKDVKLPDSKLAPKTRIARHVRISRFPKILAIHLSRSIFSASTLSTKNMAKVAFPESLPLGGILDQRKYRLLGTVTHKGGHNSGHYESFRRQITSPPYSTPHSFGLEGAYSIQGTPNPSTTHSPRIATPIIPPSTEHLPSPSPTEPTSLPSPLITDHSPSPSSLSSRSSLSHPSLRPAPTSAPRETATTPPSSSSSTQPPPSGKHLSAQNPASPSKTASITDLSKSLRASAASAAAAAGRSKKKIQNRWWRISDEKIKECRTSDVLGMQKEVYLLFYELER